MSVNDAYRVMGMPRALGIDPASVRGRMQELAKIHHPDAGGEVGRYQEITEAAAILSVPARRLRHWAELHGWRRPPGVVAMDPASGEMFARVATAVAGAGEALAVHARAGSALGKAVAERRKIQAQQELAEVLDRINAQLAAAAAEECALAAGTPLPEQAAALADRFAYLGKWQQEAREALARLA